MIFLSILIDVFATFNEIYWLYQLVNIFLDIKDNFLGKKINYNKLLKVIYVTYVLIVMSMNRIELTSAYTMLTIMIVNIMLTIAFWHSDLGEALAIVGGYFFGMFLEGNIIISLTGIIGGDELIKRCTGEQGLIRFFYLLFNTLIWYVLNKILYSILRMKKINSKSLQYVAGISIAGFFGSALIGTILVKSFSIKIGTIWYAFLSIILILIFGCYFILKKKEENARLLVLRAKNEILEKNYMQVNSFYTANAKLYHDMNHHFEAIYFMLQKGEVKEAKEYIEGLKKVSNPMLMPVNTGINVLDAVLFEMNQRAKSKGISIKVDMTMISSDFKMKNNDICSLFANLLENAIESAKGYVEVRVKKVNEMLIIIVKNDYKIKPIKHNNKYETTKKEKIFHGWGTQIIEEIVELYYGSIEYTDEDGIFSVNIAI